MITSNLSGARTRAFARVLGPFLFIVSIVAVVQAPHMRNLLDQLTANQIVLWVSGAFTLLGGIAIVAFHQYWRSAAAAIVSAVGWLTALKGFFLLALPEPFTKFADQAIGWVAVLQVVYILWAVAGLYLSYVGWRPEPSSAIQAASPTRDLPRAA